MTGEENLVEACPECDSPKLYERTASRYSEHERFLCLGCRHTFAEPTLRSPKPPGGNISSAGQALIDADPEDLDLLTDGGSTVGVYHRVFGTATPGVVEVFYYGTANHLLAEGVHR